MVWHEGVAGRATEEASNSYWQFLLTNWNKKHITIFADNCVGQNKYWTLLSMLMKAVHSAQLALQILTLKFFEPGHTSMSADSVHRGINRQLGKRSVFDFEDHVRAVEAANIRCVEPQSFLQMEDGISRQKLAKLSQTDERPYLAQMKVVQFRRDDERLFVKYSHKEQPWKAYRIFKQSFDATESPETLTAERLNRHR